MLRRFADSVYEYLLSLFPAGNTHDRRSIVEGAIPDPIRKYLIRALDARLDVEEARLRHYHDDWFDVEHPDVVRAFEAMSPTLKQHGRFPADEWPSALERAVRNVISYHARPARTLVEFLFARDGETYTAEELKQKLHFFQPYPYLEEEIDAFARANESRDFDRDTVVDLVTSIDERLAKDQNVDAWIRLLDPLYEIAAVLPEAKDSIAIELMITFFRDKGLSPVERRLERMHEEDGVDLMTREELRAILEDANRPALKPPLTVRHERIVQPEHSPAPPEPVRDREEEEEEEEPLVSRPSAQQSEEEPSSAEEEQVVAHPVIEAGSAPTLPVNSVPVQASQVRAIEPPPPAPAGPVPLWKQFQREPGSGPTRPQTPRPAPHPRPQPAPEPPQNVPSGEARPLWMRFSEKHRPDEPVRPNPGRSVADLERTVLGEQGAQHRELYVNALFAGSEAEYRDVLERLSAAPSWTDASRIIASDVFRRHRVNIYSDPAVSFTNAVESRYQNR